MGIIGREEYENRQSITQAGEISQSRGCGTALSWLLLRAIRAGCEPASERGLHAVHGLFLRRLLHSSLLLEPLLAVLADHLLHLLVVLLPALARDVLQHLALRKCSGWVLFAFGNNHDAQVLGLKPKEPAEGRHATLALVWVLLALGLELLVELGTRDSLTSCELGRDVLALKGLENLAHVAVLHGVDVFEEWDKRHQLLILGVAGPFRQYYCVLRLGADVLVARIDHDDFGKVSVQVGEVLL